MPTKSKSKKGQRPSPVGRAASGSAPNWQKIAGALYRNCAFAIKYLRGRDGSDVMVNTVTGKTRHWKHDFADSMEMIPGVKVDRDAMIACGLPRKQRQKWFAAREKEKEVAK